MLEEAQQSGVGRGGLEDGPEEGGAIEKVELILALTAAEHNAPEEYQGLERRTHFLQEAPKNRLAIQTRRCAGKSSRGSHGRRAAEAIIAW